jgi:hypothetical protein
MDEQLKNHENAKQIIDYLELKLQSDPPQPFILAGTIIQDLDLPKSDFYIAIGQILGYRVGEYREGKRKYYYLMDLVRKYQDENKK